MKKKSKMRKTVRKSVLQIIMNKYNAKLKN